MKLNNRNIVIKKVLNNSVNKKSVILQNNYNNIS
jgi:hypothetical protein